MRMTRRFIYRRSVSKAVLLSLVTALVLSRDDYGKATLAGLLARQLCRLQPVVHAAARIVFSTRKFDHVTPLLRELHWLRIPERITFKLSCLVFRSLNGTAPVYLADSINRATDVTMRRSLRSSLSTAVVVPATRCRTIGDRAFPVAAARAWNSLSSFVTLSSSLSTFKRQLKTYILVRNILLVTLILVFLVFCFPNMSTFSVIMLRVLEVYSDTQTKCHDNNFRA